MPMQITPTEIETRFYTRWGFTPKRAGQNEWHSPCPFCGGTDRFVVWANGGYMCRPGADHCGARGWLDDDKREWKPDPIQSELNRKRQVELEIARQADISRRIKQLQSDEARHAYQLGRDDERAFIAREYFRSEGIADKLIAYYALGYTDSLSVRGAGGELLQVPAYSMPIRDPQTWEIVNVQYRIADPVPSGLGKYRQVAGLDAAAFYAKPDCNADFADSPLDAVIVEGSKKAIVLDSFIESDAMQVIGLPGCTSSARINEQIKSQHRKRLWVWLDPDALEPARKLARTLGAKVIRTPMKPDDMVRSGMTRHELRQHILQAVSVV